MFGPQNPTQRSSSSSTAVLDSDPVRTRNRMLNLTEFSSLVASAFELNGELEGDSTLADSLSPVLPLENPHSFYNNSPSPFLHITPNFFAEDLDDMPSNKRTATKSKALLSPFSKLKAFLSHQPAADASLLEEHTPIPKVSLIPPTLCLSKSEDEPMFLPYLPLASQCDYGLLDRDEEESTLTNQSPLEDHEPLPGSFDHEPSSSPIADAVSHPRPHSLGEPQSLYRYSPQSDFSASSPSKSCKSLSPSSSSRSFSNSRSLSNPSLSPSNSISEATPQSSAPASSCCSVDASTVGLASTSDTQYHDDDTNYSTPDPFAKGHVQIVRHSQGYWDNYHSLLTPNTSPSSLRSAERCSSGSYGSVYSQSSYARSSVLSRTDSRSLTRTNSRHLHGSPPSSPPPSIALPSLPSTPKPSTYPITPPITPKADHISSQHSFPPYIDSPRALTSIWLTRKPKNPLPNTRTSKSEPATPSAPSFPVDGESSPPPYPYPYSTSVTPLDHSPTLTFSDHWSNLPTTTAGPRSGRSQSRKRPGSPFPFLSRKKSVDERDLAAEIESLGTRYNRSSWWDYSEDGESKPESEDGADADGEDEIEAETEAETEAELGYFTARSSMSSDLV